MTPLSRRWRTSERVSRPDTTGIAALERKSRASSSERQLLVMAREFADYEAFNIGLRGFVVGGTGAVIADLGICENDDLSGIGGIGEDFLVTGDGGIEDDFAGAFGGRTKTPALEDRSVFQGQDCRIQQQFLLGLG